MIWDELTEGIYHSGSDGALYCGHAPNILRQLPDGCIQVVVTSPPYYGLRDYGLEQVIWGGDGGCDHEWTDITGCPTKIGKQGSTETIKNPRLVEDMEMPKGGAFCCKCAAWKGCLGQEQSPQQYVQNLVSAFSEVWRVLRDDGVVWLNISDTYAANRGYQVPDSKWKDVGNAYGSRVPTGLKPKDLCLVPERLVIALQEAGWWVRCITPWLKINAMCSSQQDRPTIGHEYFLFLSKSSRYFFDLDAVRIRYTRPLDRWAGDILKADGKSDWSQATGQEAYRNRNLRPDPAGRTIRTTDFWYSALAGIVCNETSILALDMPTRPYKGAHYATFSEELIEPLVLASSSPKACPVCGAPCFVQIL